VVPANTLFISISQSGETADTLAALHKAKDLGYQATLTVCNVPGSALDRESDFMLATRAGREIGVASTKAFTTQLTVLLLLALTLGQQRGHLTKQQQLEADRALQSLPDKARQVLKLNDSIAQLAEQLVNKHHSLFLGRGPLFPVALEGALKLKELSYIHAEAYPAGELKHGPLALVDDDMPVIAVAPNNELLAKLTANLAEVKARGGVLYLFADETVDAWQDHQGHIIKLPSVADLIVPIVYTMPLQLLAYHVAVLKGTDVDQPRNLAKSVTVE
jgi:glucosamine--fructose-6-phosphate aminotransferase (isomerizing)